MSYEDTIRAIYGLQKFGIKLGLYNISRLLEALGNPQDRLQTVIIGGTNGKGSTARFVSTILAESGMRAGLYTSPHLQRFTERIQVNNAEIEQGKVVKLAGRINQALDRLNGTGEDVRIRITFFEFVTAMALLHFEETGVDLAVLEVGMGGRLDATNACPAVASVITNIGLDHEIHLGQGELKIASEKAGIIKPDGRLVTAERKEPILDVFTEACRERKADMIRMDRDFFCVRDRDGSLRYRGLSREIGGLNPGLLGDHQSENVGCALALLELLQREGFQWNEDAIHRGVASASWPGRLEFYPKDPPVILDGAHNPDAVGKLVGFLEGRLSDSGQRPVFVVGMMTEKDHRACLSLLSRIGGRLILTRSSAIHR